MAPFIISPYLTFDDTNGADDLSNTLQRDARWQRHKAQAELLNDVVKVDPNNPKAATIELRWAAYDKISNNRDAINDLLNYLVEIQGQSRYDIKDVNARSDINR